jgi:hypothetical protein
MPLRSLHRPRPAARCATASAAVASLAAVIAVALAPNAAAVGRTPVAARAAGHSVLASRLLWATVDVCNPPDQKHTIGVRGSMPGDGTSNETMFMRFRVQYRDPKSSQWRDISANADSGYVNVGSARYRVREAGRSFEFLPAPHQPAYRLRGMVTFQWRRGTKIVYSASLYTTGGHVSAAGADPKNFSSSTCIIS